MFFTVLTVVATLIWAVVLGNSVRLPNQKQKIPKAVWSIDETYFRPTGLLDTLYKDLLADRSQDKYANYKTDSNEGFNTMVNSTCPWAYRVAWNLNRIPSHHVEAVCLSSVCLKPNAMETANEDYDIMESQTMCSKIEYVRWVKVRDDKSKTFKKKLLKFTVGCTCESSPYQDS